MSDRVTLPDDLTEDEAVELYWDLRRKFGWAGTIFVRSDIQHYWTDDDGNELPFTDQDWENVQTTWEWRKGLVDHFCEVFQEIVYDIVEEARKRPPSN